MSELHLSKRYDIIDMFNDTSRHLDDIFTICNPEYGMPGLVPLINVLFLGQCDFHITLSGRDMSGNVRNRLFGSYMANMGISLNNMKSSSTKCYMTFLGITIYKDTLNW